MGAGEVLGSTLSTNGDAELDSNWENFVTPTTNERSIEQVHGGTYSRKCVADTGNGIKNTPHGQTLKKLYKVTSWHYLSAGTLGILLANAAGTTGGYNTETVHSATGAWTKTEYYAVENSGVGTAARPNYVSRTTPSTFYIDDIAEQEVTVPAATCLYAYKSVNGSQGWHMAGSFNMNASAYTYDIYELGETALVCVGGKSTAAAGDPYLGHSTVTRARGLTMVAGPFEALDATLVYEVGFDHTNQTGALAADCVHIESDTLKPYDGGSAGPTVLVPADNTKYYWAIRLLAAGAEYYYRTLTGYWKMLWRGGTDATAALYPGISGKSAAFTISKPGMQLLPSPWNPSCLLYHDFAGDADGAITTSEALDGDGVSAPVRTWLGTTATVSSSKMILTPGLGEELATGNLTVGGWYSITATEVDHFFTGCAIGNAFRATAATALDANNKVKLATRATLLQPANLGTSDVLADCYITALTAATQAGLALCWDSESNPQNGLLVYYDGAGNIKLDKCVAGTWSNVASTAQAHSADARLRAIKDSTGVTIYHADTIIGSTNSVTDAGIISNTLHGVFSTYEGNTFSKVHVMKRGALNEFRELDNYIH